MNPLRSLTGLVLRNPDLYKRDDLEAAIAYDVLPYFGKEVIGLLIDFPDLFWKVYMNLPSTFRSYEGKRLFPYPQERLQELFQTDERARQKAIRAAGKSTFFEALAKVLVSQPELRKLARERDRLEPEMTSKEAPAVYITFYYQSELDEAEIERLDAAINAALAKRYHQDVVYFDDGGEERGGRGRAWIMVDIASNAQELDDPREAQALIEDVANLVKRTLVRYNPGLTAQDIEVEVDDSLL